MKTSLVASLPPGLQYDLSSPSRNPDVPYRCPTLSRWCGYLPSITDVWNSPPFSSLPSFPPSHTLWDMIMNDKGISLEIWDQFIGGDVLSITFWRLSPLPLSFHFIFHFGPIYLLISMITLPSTPCLSVISAYSHNHFLSCILFMCSLVDPISPFPFMSLPALKAFLHIYSRLFSLMYLHLDLHQSMCWSSFCSLQSLLLLEPISLALDRTPPLSIYLQMRLCHHLSVIDRCQHLLAHCSHNSTSAFMVGSWSPGPLTVASSV